VSDERNDWFRGPNGTTTAAPPPIPPSVVPSPPIPPSVAPPSPIPPSVAPPPIPVALPTTSPPPGDADLSGPVLESNVADGRRRAILVAVLVVAIVAIVVGVKSRHAKPSFVATPGPATMPIAAPSPAPRPAPAPPPEIALDPGAPAHPSAPAAPAVPAEAPADDGRAEEAETARHHHHHHEHREHHSHEHHHAHAEHHAATKQHEAKQHEAKQHEAKEPTTKAAKGGDRDAARVAYQRGSGLLLSGDAAGAVAAYQDAVRRAPSDPIGYRGLGLAYEKQGKTSEAVSALVSYLKLSKHARDREVIARRLYRLTHADDGGLAH
jgi:hypothetical protein